MTIKYTLALQKFRDMIIEGGDQIELSHAENTLYWLHILSPSADEILSLSAFAHDIERSSPHKISKNDFNNYDDYKRAHSELSGEIAARTIMDFGYTVKEADRIATIIEAAEFQSKNPEVQLLCDADSISYFDNNIDNYIRKNDESTTKKKVDFMYKRSTYRARQFIDKILIEKGLAHLLTN